MKNTFSFKRIMALLLVAVMFISMCGVAEDAHMEAHDFSHDVAAFYNLESNDETGNGGDEVCDHSWINGVCSLCNEGCGHTFFTDGVCDRCGFVCDHPRQREQDPYYGETVFVNGDENGCNGYEEMFINVQCLECGKVVDTRLTEETFEGIPHEFDENGNCIACNYRANEGDESSDDCEHLNVHTESFGVIIKESDAVLSSGQNGHELTVEQWIGTNCNDCGLYTEEFTGETYPYVFEHEWTEEGICWVCNWENECEHSGEKEIWTEFASGSYEIIDAQQHKFTGSLVEYTRCVDCGEVSAEEIDPNAVEINAHTIGSEGMCVNCGFEPDCGGHDTLEVTVYEKKIPTYYDYIHDSDARHIVRGVFDAYGLCDECGLLVYLGEEEAEISEAHSLDWEHDSYWDIHRDGSGNAVYAEVVNGYTHNVEVVWMTNYECSMCNFWVSVMDENQTEMQERDHDWMDGVCSVCGYEPDCDHVAEYEIWTQFEQYEHGQLGEEHPDNANQHYRKGDEVEYTRCSYCSAILKRDVLEAGKVIYEGHAFNTDGFCGTCGYDAGIECEVDHNTLPMETTYTELDTWWENEFQHCSNREYMVTATCESCGMSFVNEIYYDVVLVDHTPAGEPFYFDWTAMTEDRDAVVDVNDNEHFIRWHKFYVYDCANCNGGVTVFTEEYEDFSFGHDWDENGVCRVCDYENSCAHNRTVDEETFFHNGERYQPVEGNQHKIVGNKVIVTHCEFCWQELNVEIVEENAVIYEDHQLDINGYCMSNCGFKSDCDHSALEYEWVYDDEVIHRIEWVNEEQHECEGDVVYTATCDVCGLSIEQERKVEIYTVDHEKTEYLHDEWHWDDTAEDFVESFNEDAHVVKYAKYDVYYCAFCGGEFRVKTEEAEYIEEGHDYNTDSACRACGFVNPCPHKKVEAFEEFWPEYIGEYLEKQHVWYGKMMNIEQCTDCGQRMKEEIIEEDYAGIYEDHRFDLDSVCMDCGYASTSLCDHSGLEFEEEILVIHGSWMEDMNNHFVQYERGEVAVCEACGNKIYKDVIYVEESMPHENLVMHWNDWDAGRALGDPDFLQDANDYEHTVKQYEYAGFECEICGYFEVDTGAYRYETMGHDWVNDVCETCGYDNPCEHQYGIETHEEFWGDGMEPVDAEQHVEYGTLMEVEYCVNCWQRMEETVLEENYEAYSTHVFDTENNCMYCGYYTECDHSALEFEEVIENLHYWNNGDETHTKAYEFVEVAACDVCGMMIYASNEYIEEIEDHEKSHLEWTDWSWELAGEDDDYIQSIDEEMHTLKQYEIQGYICDICDGGYFEAITGNTRYDAGWHEWESDGKCIWCGYTNSCAHDEGYVYEEHTFDVEYNSVGAEKHSVTRETIKTGFCMMCRQPMVEIGSTKVTSEEPHRFDQNGWCMDCGCFAGNKCDHEGIVYNEKVVQDAWCEDRGDHHAFMEFYYMKGVCPECGVTLYGDGYDAETVGEHNWNTENINVHYENADPFVVAFDENSHTIEYIVYQGVWCEDCGTYSEEVIAPYGTSLIEQHLFNMEGICDTCEYTNACKHENYNVVDEEWWQNIEMVDEKQHAVTIVEVDAYYCSDCGYLFKADEKDSYVINEAHMLNIGGACFDCEYIALCDHSTLELANEVKIYDWYYQKDDKQHIRETGYTYEAICPVCEQCIRDGDKTENVDEPHAFNDGGRCELCGYVCKHEDTIALDPVITVTGYKSVSATKHVAYGSQQAKALCACGEEVLGDITDWTGAEEAHTFASGKCTVCDYACEHEAVEMTDKALEKEWYEPVDVASHKYCATYQLSGVCGNCADTVYGEKVTEETVGEHTLVKDEETGYRNCEICGYVCKHEDTIALDPVITVTGHKSVSATKHVAYGSQQAKALCVCGEEVLGDITDWTGAEEAHTFATGKCTLCGYKKPAPTAAPTAKPTVESTPAPVLETVAEPSVRMVETLVTIMESKTEVVEEGTAVTVVIFNSEKVMNETEKASYDTLSYADQIMVLMRVLQYDGEADYAEENLDVEMSVEAQALVETITARFAAMSEEEKAEYLAVLAEAFPTTEMEIDGEIYEVVAFIIQVTIDDEVVYEQYTFRLDEETGMWMFVGVQIIDEPAEPEAVEAVEGAEA